MYFYPRPLRRGRQWSCDFETTTSEISIHALFAEGDDAGIYILGCIYISIHALFAEGDPRQADLAAVVTYFYPRPLRRGRLCACWSSICTSNNFYPRPLRRGRPRIMCPSSCAIVFLSTPSSQRATCGRFDRKRQYSISIHALFAEGDITRMFTMCWLQAFLSTPSSQRATSTAHRKIIRSKISIHALFAEGDPLYIQMFTCNFISIHALFAEGDVRISK